MNRSQSWKKIPSEEAAEFKEGKRATSHPNLSHSASLGNAELRTSRASVEDLRRKIVRLNKELDAEKAFVKQLRREKSIDLKHAREEEQRRAASMQTDLKTKLHKEKTNELTALREQMHKDKEKEILQIIRQKDDSMKMAQQNWLKEKEELRAKLRAELFSDAKEESKKEFDRERTRLEQEILDLKMQKKEMEEALKILQESDKRKADEIRRIFHEHEIELEKFKRNSWQESRRQMGEIRQLLNIIEQLERKLGIDSGHINKLRMEKESLYDELRRKTNTFDAWDSMMSSSSSSSSAKNDSDTSGATFPSPNTDPKYSGVSNEIRTLQRKNTELSSLVKKLDEKNQQLATKNAELLSELERSDKEARDKSKKLEKKNFELTQNAKKLESKNKALQDEVNTHKRKPASCSSSKDAGGKMDKSVRVRGQTSQADSTDVISLKQQVKDQSKTIEELKQNLMEKERRIDLLKERKKSGKKAKSGRTSVDAVLHQEHDDAVSSDISDISEMSSNDSNSDANKLKKLAKELLALERAYALLQAQVGSTVDVERDELERQQLQSDLIESQARIHELERMMDSSVQGAGVEELQQLQHDNKILYQKLIAAENERDRTQNELLKNSEDLRDLQDKKDLLEFELEEMSQLSFAGSEDEFVSPRKTREKEDRKLPLSLEEVKAYLEEMENEKTNVLSVMELEALKQARISLTAMPQKISHLEATEAVLRSKVKDLEERPNESRSSTRIIEFPFNEELEDSLNREESSLSRHGDLIDQYTSTDITLEDITYFENLEVKHHELLLQTRHGNKPLIDGSMSVRDKNGKPVLANKTDQETSTELTLEDLMYFEKLEVEHYEIMLEKKQQQGRLAINDETFSEPSQASFSSVQNQDAADDSRDSARDDAGDDNAKVGVKDFENLKSKYDQLLLEREQLITAESEAGLRTVDIKDYENLNEKYNELLSEREQLIAAESEARLRTVDIKDYENLNEKYNELLSERDHLIAAQTGESISTVDQEDYEHLKNKYDELLSEKEQWSVAGFRTGMVPVNQEDYEKLREEIDELLLEKEQWTAARVLDQEENENLKEKLNELLKEKEHWSAVRYTTGMLPVDKEDYEHLKEKYEELLSEKENWSAAGLHELSDKSGSKDDLETSTDLTLDDLEYLENLEMDYRELKELHQQSLCQQYDNMNRSSSDDKENTTDQAIGTDMSLADLQSLQDAGNEYKNLLLAQQETQAYRNEDRAVETDFKMADLEYLEQVDEIHRECVESNQTVKLDQGVVTDLMLTDLHLLEEIEAVHQQCMTAADNDISSSRTDTSDMGVGTEITSSVLEYLEEVAVAHKGIVREYEAFRKSVTKEKEDVILMTEITGKHLEKMAVKSEELEKMLSEAEVKRERRKDKALMTELSSDRLKILEKSDNIYRKLQDRGIISRLQQMHKPKREYATPTDLLVSNIEYLEDIERLYRGLERKREHRVDKSMETDMTQNDLRQIENLANNAMDTVNSKNRKIEEKITAKTNQESHPQGRRDVNGRYGDTSRHGDTVRYGDRKGVSTVEVGVQCELKDLLSLIREQQEQDGGSGDAEWFISAVKVDREKRDGFDPVEVVLRHRPRISSTPDVTSRRDYGNKRYSLDSKRHSSNVSLNLDYAWQSSSSLDISGQDKTLSRGPGQFGRWDSPRVPLAQDETFDLSDIESAASEESLLHARQTTDMESAVKQFDRYIMARKQSEKDLLSDLRENDDEEDGQYQQYQPKSMAVLLKENERLRLRNMELELIVAQKGDLSDEELQLLKEKIQQLREAEQRMEMLHVSNTALKDRINQLQEDHLPSGASTSRSVRDNWSEIDPSEGRTRLLLVQDWGLGESDLESLFSAREGVVSPADSIETSALRRLLDEYAKSDHATQAGPGPGVSQEIQTTGDLLKLIDLSYDGTIPEHIAKELEKLKAENKELYEELLELRRLKLANSTPRNQGQGKRTVEEPVRTGVQSKAESKNDGKSARNDREKSKAPVKDFDEPFKKPLPKPRDTKRQQHPRSKVNEPQILSSRSTRNTKAHMDQEEVRHRTDTDDILDFEFGEDAPPEVAPPPIPSDPPPDLPDNEPDDMVFGSETVLGSSPPRDSRALRAASRQKNYPVGRAVVGETAIEANEDLNVGEPGVGTSLPGRIEISPALRTSQTSSLQTSSRSGPGMPRPVFTPKPAPPPTLPKPKMSGRRTQGAPKPGILSTPLTRSRESLNDEEMGLTPRGYVRATASAINQGELDALGEKINFLEKQLKNKENVIRSMKTEASELEKQALLERREREIKILEDDIAFLKQENQKKERELLNKIGELNRKSYEVDQWKAEASNAEKQRKRIETSYMNLQSQTRNLQGSDSKLTGLQSKYSTLEKEHKQLKDKVKKLEKTENEFKQLEFNISVLQNHLQDMESVEKERDDLMNKLKIVEDQRDDLLQKGRMVESERNDFLRNNKVMELQRDELEQRYAIAHKNQMDLKAAAGEMEQKIQDAQNKTLDAQHERNYVQVQYNKLEAEKNELLQQLAAVTQERNSLETRLAELEDRNREYIKLEDGFHTLRLKAAELTRQRDDFEMQIPTLKAKVALLKKACKEKDEFIDKLNDEIRELRHAIATSTLDDLSKIRSYGYSPENFVKYSSQRDGDEKDSPKDVVDAKPRPDAHISPKSKSKSPLPKIFVAIFDYDPHKASVSGCPESELTLKEGDQLMVFGDMDTNGCFEAELNGVRGLVPGLYVEELEDGDLHSVPNGTTDQEKRRNAKGRLSNGNCEPDTVSSGHSSMSPRSSCADPELQRQCCVALFDYNPYQSCTTGRPELELPLKKGDIMTVIGEVDVNGYYKAEMEGQTGLVPSNFVEEVSSSSFLLPTSSTAPEQILGMLDNIKVPSPKTSGSSPHLPMPSFPNADPSLPTHPGTVNLVPSSHVEQPVAMVTVVSPRKDQHIQPIFTPYMSPAEVQKLAAPITSTSPTKPRARTSHRSPRQQTASSPRSHGMTSQLSPSKQPIPSQPMTSPPQITSQVHRSSVQPVNKPKPRQSKALVPHSQPVGQRGPPCPPSSLHVLRPVNHDAILLGWALPEMDEFGRSNGVVVKGYKIYENGDYKMDVSSQFMSKALVDDLDLRYPILFTIHAVGADGSLSNDVSTTFTDTVNNSRLSVSKAIEGTVSNGSHQKRVFVALYDYDPMKSSPNSNPQYELKFNEGDILRVEDTTRKDGFYFGSLNDKKGLIPSNFVEEVAVAKARGPSPSRKSGSSRVITNGMNGTVSPSPTPRNGKKMIALYDYNPSEQSPLDDPKSELSFQKGQEVTVFGTANKDGFYHAETNGRKGLVPASFLESSLDTTQKSSNSNKKYRS